MAIHLSSLQRGRRLGPPRILIHGEHGLGKSTFASQAPRPIFIPTEDGLGAIDTTAFPLAHSYQEVLDDIGALFTEEHEYQSVVIDSLDWLEDLIWKHVASEGGHEHIEDFGYGKGYVLAADRFREVLAGLGALRDTKGMAVILTAHCQVKRFDDPASEPYDRYTLKLHAKAAALVQEWVDVVGFVSQDMVVKKEDVGFNKKSPAASPSAAMSCTSSAPRRTTPRTASAFRTRCPSPGTRSPRPSPNRRMLQTARRYPRRRTMPNLEGYNAEEYQPMENYEALPAGDYRAIATSSEMRPTKAGAGAYLQIAWEVIDSEYKGRKLWSRLNLQNPSPKAVEIAQRELSSICRAAGVLRPRDSAELHNIPVLLKVGTERRSDTGELQNRIKGYAAIASAPAAQKPAVTTSPAKPPWKR